MPDTEICSMQISVPHVNHNVFRIQGIRNDIVKWFEERHYQPRYQGINLNGNQDGRLSSIYLVNNIEKNDILIFKLIFPYCGVFIFESKNHVDD